MWTIAGLFAFLWLFGPSVFRKIQRAAHSTNEPKELDNLARERMTRHLLRRYSGQPIPVQRAELVCARNRGELPDWVTEVHLTDPNRFREALGDHPIV
jgi:hypothetical protein